MAAMTQRPTAPTERARACPFLAFEDDRDMRSDRPDHRHRCFAEKRPAPRAIAHQEAFCLSPSFPACPTFQDWARREAAQARNVAASAAGSASIVASGMAAGPGEAGGDEPREDGRGLARSDDLPEDRGDLGLMADDDDHDDRTHDETDDDDRAARADRDRDRGQDRDRDRAPDDLDAPGYEPPEPGWLPDIPDIPAARNASRSWAAPPPWAPAKDAPGTTRPSRSTGSDRADADAPPPAGLASSRWLTDVQPGDELDGDDDDGGPSASGQDPAAWPRPQTPSVTPAFLAGRAATDETADASPDQELAALVTRNRPAGSPARRDARPMAGQPRQARRQPPPPRDEVGPSWERPRRFEAYPTLKTRVGMPAVPRIAVGLLALVVAAVLVFMIPALFFSKAAPGASSSASASIAPSVSLVPTATAAPTQTTYTIAKGDNLSKIAKKFGVTQAQILTANPQIKDPNKIKIGDVIIIPLAIPSEIIDSTSPSASPGDSASTSP
jgi:LysM repeat protein